MSRSVPSKREKVVSCFLRLKKKVRHRRNEISFNKNALFQGHNKMCAQQYTAKP